LDGVYGFGKHFLRGLQKMKLRCTLALMVMLAMAVGRIRGKTGGKYKEPGKGGLSQLKLNIKKDLSSRGLVRPFQGFAVSYWF